MEDELMLVEAGLVGLVGYRLWRFLAVDTITDRLRELLPEGWAEMWGCGWCLGFWCCLLVGALGWWVGVLNGPPLLVVPAGSVVCGILADHL